MQSSMAGSLESGSGTRNCRIFGFRSDILHEIFKHLDAESVGRVSCVCRRWRQAAYDERLWETICTRRWQANALFVSAERLRAVVAALGGFRRLYINCVHPLLARSERRARRGPSTLNSSNNLAPQCLWSEDEIHLSLSLFSIDYYERIDPLTSCYNNACSSLDILTASPRSAHSGQSGGPDIRKLLQERKNRCTYQFPVIINKPSAHAAGDEELPGRAACNKRKQQPHGRREFIAGIDPIDSRSMKRTDSKLS